MTLVPYDLAKLIVSLHRRGDTKPKIITRYIEELYHLAGDQEEAESLMRQARNEENDRRHRLALVTGR